MLVGVDIGGTSIKGAIFDSSGTMCDMHSVPTQAHKGRQYIYAQLCKVIDQLIDGVTVSAIGVGSAGRIDVSSGSVFYATDNLPGWTGFALGETLSRQYGVPVAVDNDVNAAALGECWMGSARDSLSSVFVALGTGVGGGLIHRGEVIRGGHWSAGELGHLILHPNGLPCNCGLQGCAEQYLSGTALGRMGKSLGLPVDSGVEVMEQAVAGHPKAKEIVGQFVSDLVLFLVNIQQFYDPEMIVIGGGVLQSRPVWETLLLEALGRTPLPISINWSQLGDSAGIYGAAKLALDRSSAIDL